MPLDHESESEKGRVLVPRARRLLAERRGERGGPPPPEDRGLLLAQPRGFRIWELLDGTREPGEIGRLLAREFSIPESEMARDLEAFGASLEREDLLERNVAKSMDKRRRSHGT